MKKHYSSIISDYFGVFASKAFSRPIQKIINNSYVKLMGLDMSEFKEPREYRTLNSLFTRALRRPREIEPNPKVLISPVDALVTDYGKIIKGKAYQIKGMEYSIERLFGSYHKEALKYIEGGEFINLYLSPKDYHRYHAPSQLKIKSLTHIPGKLYPVNFPLLQNKKELFVENERVVIECQDSDGYLFVIVLIGALNVGKMVISFEDRINTNSKIKEPKHYKYENLILQKGELLGWFEMGSTVLLFCEKDRLLLEIAINQKVRFTQPIGKII
jgi:phosphatidylserine decarboxylase